MQYAVDVGAKNILGVRFASPDKEKGTLWSLDSFLGALLESNMNRRHPPEATVLRLDTGNVTQPLYFKLDHREKKRLYDSGYQQTHLYFKKRQ